MDNKEMTIREIFGQRLNSALAQRDVQQIDLARGLGYNERTANTISYYCSGKRTPNLEQLAKISTILNVSTDYLLGFDDHMIKNAELRAICDYTGLSENAVETLNKNFVVSKDDDKTRTIMKPYKDALSAFVGQGNFFDLVERSLMIIEKAKRLEDSEHLEESVDSLYASLYALNETLRDILNNIYPLDDAIRKARKEIQSARDKASEEGFEEGMNEDGKG